MQSLRVTRLMTRLCDETCIMMSEYIAVTNCCEFGFHLRAGISFMSRKTCIQYKYF